MSVQSNAFNFMSFAQGSVDPRTGIYGFTVDLPALNANLQRGPTLPLSLAFNPLNGDNVGLGRGWSLTSSRYDLKDGMLSLHTGESFQVIDNGPGKTMLVPERKLETFHIENLGPAHGARYRVAHASGLVELLEVQHDVDQVALPVRIYAPTGHSIRLDYDDQARLVSIRDDDDRQLLAIEYVGNAQVWLDLHPNSVAWARYTLELQGDELRDLILPTNDHNKWHFEYASKGGSLVLERLDSPAGGTERLTYTERGHALPGVEGWLPYVHRHDIQPDPSDSTTHLRTEYNFTSTNYLGNGAAGVVWNEHYRQDHLYLFTGTDYTYGCTVTHYCDGEPQRTEERVFNRFHLLIQQTNTDLLAGCIETMTTRYHELDNVSFAHQPAFFQLPSKVTRSWREVDNSTDYREEVTLTRFDVHGNVTEETLPSGIRHVREYYPAQASDGCPQDPEGFVRNLKHITVYPATTDVSGAPAQIMRTQYRYQAYAPLNGAAAQQASSSWLAADEVQWVQLKPATDGEDAAEERVLRTIKTAYLHMPDKPRLHGRPDCETVSLNGTTSRTSWSYQVLPDAQGQRTQLMTKRQFKAAGGTLAKSFEQLDCGLTGRLIEAQDVNGLVSRYHYDVLGRLIEEHLNPDDPAHRITTTYAYTPVRENNRILQAEHRIDAKGVINRVVYDGSLRKLREEREITDPDTRERITRKTAEYRYDTLGRLASETAFDYVIDDPDGDAPTERTLCMATHYTYDGWGGLRTTTHPDMSREHRVFSPFGKEGHTVTHWLEPADQPGVARQLSVVEYNRFGNPAYEYSLQADPASAATSESEPTREVGRIDYRYDGLGRCVKRLRTLNIQTQIQAPVVRTDEYHYDCWGRLDETKRADGSSLMRSFAPHSVSELTTLLAIRKQVGAAPQPVCKRQFDGLDRLREVQVGKRVETYDYRGLTNLIETRTTRDSQAKHGNSARQRTIVYQYTPELSSEPYHLSATTEQDGFKLAVNEANFEYDPLTAELSGARNDNGERQYEYTDQGFLQSESWEGARQHDTHNRFSVLGRPTYRKHSDGAARLYRYDTLGRVERIEDDELRCTLRYNGLGQLEETLTCNLAKPDHYVKCTQTYDELGREHTRTLESHDQAVQVLTLTWRDDGLLETRTLTRAGAPARCETFSYDELGRLELHECEGSELPRDTAGRAIVSQALRFDEHDNVTRRVTSFADGSTERLDFAYDETDPFRLVSLTPDRDASRTQLFDYDELGNLLNDEQGRRLQYDSLGRLNRVMSADGRTLLTEYRYDGHNQLVAAVHEGNRQVMRRYDGYRLDATLEDDTLTQYLYAGAGPVAERRSGDHDRTTLMMTDHMGSVLTECDEEATRSGNYTAYGERASDSELKSLVAFNGEAREQAYGWYLLGSGYRAYNPVLMRFHSPDSLAPELSGVNPYVYTLGDPVNWRDPSGHRAQMPGDRTPPKYKDPVEEPGFSWLEAIPVALKLVMVAGLVGVTLASGGLSIVQMAAAAGMVGGIGLESAGLIVSATGGEKQLAQALRVSGESMFQAASMLFMLGGRTNVKTGPGSGTSDSATPSPTGAGSREGSLQRNGSLSGSNTSPVSGGSQNGATNGGGTPNGGRRRSLDGAQVGPSTEGTNGVVTSQEVNANGGGMNGSHVLEQPVPMIQQASSAPPPPAPPSNTPTTPKTFKTSKTSKTPKPAIQQSNLGQHRYGGLVPLPGLVEIA